MTNRPTTMTKRFVLHMKIVCKVCIIYMVNVYRACIILAVSVIVLLLTVGPPKGYGWPIG
ncbi:MAG TPA: hypothetical protein VF575_00765 [Candidatus Saccharimonadales bacterium]|jgi:hypothetical protein